MLEIGRGECSVCDELIDLMHKEESGSDMGNEMLEMLLFHRKKDHK